MGQPFSAGGRDVSYGGQRGNPGRLRLDVAFEDYPWAYRTPSLNGLSYRFAVRSDDGRLGRYVHSLLEGLREMRADG